MYSTNGLGKYGMYSTATVIEFWKAGASISKKDNSSSLNEIDSIDNGVVNEYKGGISEII